MSREQLMPHEQLMLHAQLQQFADHLRDPQRPAPAGIEERRLQVYRELFFSNVSQLLAGMFPLARSVLAEQQWSALLHDFYRQHRCETPLFPYLAEEFLLYLQSAEPAGLPAWFFPLAHYEWMESALRYSDDEPLEMADTSALTDQQLLQAQLLRSPLCWPLLYDWPVHRIGRHWQPAGVADAGQTCLLLFRDRDDELVLLESTAVTFALLHQLAEGATVRQAIAAVADSCAVSPNGEFTAQALVSLRDLLQRGLLLLRA